MFRFHAKIFNLTILFFLFFVFSSTTKPESQAIDKPNIILFFIDDLGKEWLSCYGSEEVVTPNIDALAQSGIKFNNVYGMPQCTPSRVTLLTGQYPFRHGWVNHWDVPRWGGGAHFDERLNPSLPLEMQNAGYTTCIAGKWQIDDFRVEPDALTKVGFDEFCMWTGFEKGNPAPTGKRYHNPYIFTKEGSKTYQGEYGPDVFKDFVIDFLRKNQEKPMFVYYPMVLTHGPYHPTPLGGKTGDKLGIHKAMVAYTDFITGEIVNELEALGIRKKTLIIWTTDNGSSKIFEAKMNGRLVQGGKSLTTESGINLPFIASWPGTIPKNIESDALIDFTDFYPTFLDIAKIDMDIIRNQADENRKIDGVSFKSVLLQNDSISSRSWILSMGGKNNAKLTENGVENQYIFRDRVVRNSRFKLYIGTDRSLNAFYDIQNDPSEKENLIRKLDTQERIDNFNQLSRTLDYFYIQDSDPKYIPNPKQPWDTEIKAKSQVWKKLK